jgi:succinyl-CoA synthetase alpha subunit
MSILVNKNTRLIVQGITGTQGKLHTQKMQEYGTNIVAGVTPGKGGLEVFGIPVYDTVEQAVKATGANTSIIYVPAKYAPDSIFEAIDAQLDLVVCITEGIPVLDLMTIKSYLKNKKTKLLGPNCPGVITPNECKAGILPASIHKKGHIGVVSRSGTLTYEAVNQLTQFSLGQSTAVGIGGDPIKGLGFIDVLKMFNDDNDTHAIVMIGEIGGTGEEEAAQWIKENLTKPLVTYIAGQTAPPGKRMGHAGAIISGGKGTAQSKNNALTESGAYVVKTPDMIGETTYNVLKNAGLIDKCLIKQQLS